MKRIILSGLLFCGAFAAYSQESNLENTMYTGTIVEKNGGGYPGHAPGTWSGAKIDGGHGSSAPGTWTGAMGIAEGGSAPGTWTGAMGIAEGGGYPGHAPGTRSGFIVVKDDITGQVYISLPNGVEFTVGAKVKYIIKGNLAEIKE